MNEHRVSQLLDEARYFEDHQMWLHAVQVYQRLLEEHPKELHFRVRLGMVYLEMGNLKAAEQVLLHAIRYDEHNPDILYSLGVICYKSKDYDRALFYLQQLAGKRLSKAHYSLGLVHWQRGDYEHAARHFRLTLEIQPDNFDAAIALGEVCLRSNQIGPAITALEDAAKISPESAITYHLLGAVYASIEAWDDMIDSLQRAIVLEPDNNIVVLDLAGAYLASENLDEAERLYKSLLHDDDRAVAAMLGLGQIALLKAQIKRAEQYFNKILAIQPGHEAALAHLQYLAPHGKTMS